MSVSIESKHSSYLLTSAVIFCALSFVFVSSTLAQEKMETEKAVDTGSLSSEAAEATTFQFARTDSPRDTLSSFIRLTGVLERARC